ncbi:MAG: type II toxin-antitoxin system prevent-host-death family antitoxin, partial [Candidatus Aureabacteria bacterium]|nr:type II toxin-antitoxin system prevent-host-death family antitoxin [Candidatus Auribacterota bacterium]
MTISTLADVKNNLSRYLRKAEREPIFITRSGKIAGVLESISEDEMEDYLLERSPKFRAMLDKARASKAGISLGEYR